MSPTAGLGFKLQHIDEALAARDAGLWFEVHAENYMVDGGPRLVALMALRERHPISLHGVGLSLASTTPPPNDHLDRLKKLTDRVAPMLVSDHLAWQRWNGTHHADFLPFPRTRAALTRTAENIDRVQTALGRQILVENPSLYVDLPGHEMTEAQFLTELAACTGCGLLVDVNNLYVSAHNTGLDADAALDALPASAIGEMHLAGHAQESDPASNLLIDTHGTPIGEAVWTLYERLIRRVGFRPTLIERDDDVPPFADLLRERDRAHAVLRMREPALA